ncbi:endonuclease domain-containing protein [Dactylosporangium matsuzakiense]|uniref:DUF559 domain-containing protein n=1 Tax=Dactylosporangium matsuzakiense TaxID=53360 RepID=A0A9W6KUT3_9ACTN|nr:endonuclease domain-containing protein [Dactylosporangium matsuzakiense]UWZ42405.1 DUF559 domain-containing protein [Dactylosporangium matsuzakiense]GLL07612.1 hypothetical protein GCM10017581_093660 [Dactylosporangium matsuzakiense]
MAIIEAPTLVSVIMSMLQAIEAVKIKTFPEWLPAARALTGGDSSPSATAVAAIHALALTEAAHSQHYGPYLADLAVAAFLGQPLAEDRFAPEIRANGLARLVAGSGQPVLVVTVAAAFSDDEEPTAIGAAQWICGRVGIGVWFVGKPLAATQDLLLMTAPPPPASRPPATRPPQSGSCNVVAPDRPAPTTGRPHPTSDSEQRLEAALQRCDWASGRAWNQTYRRGPLSNVIRVDLLWPHEKCVVEIDGADHRRSKKYLADRRRDVDLQLDGYAVLRFTNEQIRDDIGAVIIQIEHLVRARRGNTEAQHHVG